MTGQATNAASSSSGKWRDLRLRLLSAAVMAPLALACLYEGRLFWAVLMGIAALGISLEWVRLCGAKERAWPGSGVPLFILLGGGIAVAHHVVTGLIVLLIGGALIVWLGRAARHPLTLGAGVPYLGACLLTLIWLRYDPVVGRANVLFLVISVWASDIGAYLAGRLIGGAKLAPSISPGKTWSGAVGGVVAAMGTGLAIAPVLHSGPAIGALWVACLIAVVSQGGDLLESGLKRRFGVKDSGTLIPGHGGLLDRLDGLLTAAPVVAVLAALLGRGVAVWQ
ncbi:Phosphatidate cytidylyltransferase [Granulibacter bethesdensis]|uniref:Phosphatidate cytidylyltransferase n=1 Tax=Granulibacter bethesdensis TaxID=364410 RepID=A0AAC9P8I6_9PROT|nr:phosphatidate cytidylyltransferase [Granulibacter bethesdensis]APH54230.1 Phosphatidate cytidylyltransferase [Granulibacter bethesdensis]APH61815.1 Phosphatidate cytidylyltransferase [Granulibacter bethesdensis]